MRTRRSIRRAAALVAAGAAAELVLAPAASASGGRPGVPVALLGIPSLHSIIQAIANGFFSALAGALVPSWLRHGTVATIQHLVALPDPATWPHVGRLQSDTTFLGAMLLPLTLAIGAARYWAIGLTGAAHPASAVTRSVTVTGVLVVYRWGIEQTVAATNTLTHGLLELPAVGGGLQRIIGVLFGGALLTGTGGVFGAFLVIVGVVFAAGLFAAQVLMTVILAVLIVAGPPLIALSAIPELSHLARSWCYAVLAVALVPVGWTVLFATAGALCLDATSFTGAGGGLPGHVAAAFAGLITFVIAVRLPLMAAGELRHLFHGPRGAGPATTGAASRGAGVERVRAAHARLRAVGLEGVPSLGRSAGRAAGALGAPAGGLLGATRRRVSTATGLSRARGGAPARTAPNPSRRAGVARRLANARRILADAPADASAAVAASSRRSRVRNVSGRGGAKTGPGASENPGSRNRPPASGANPGRVTASRTERGGGGVAPRAPTGARSASTPPAAPSQAAARPGQATPAKPPIARPDAGAPAPVSRRGAEDGSPPPTPAGSPAKPRGKTRSAIPREAPPAREPPKQPRRAATPRSRPAPKRRRKGRA